MSTTTNEAAEVKPQAGISATSIGTAEEAEKEFRKRANKRKVNLGGNEGDTDEFLQAINRATMRGTFGVDEVMRECKGADIDPRRATQLFASWLAVNLEKNRVVSVQTCYDVPQWIRV